MANTSTGPKVDEKHTYAQRRGSGLQERENITDRVFRVLRERILNGEIPPGSQHSVYRLAEELGVSRTPVREAVLRLADTRMVTVEKNRGIRIRGVTVDDIREVFELRLLLEVPAAALAARKGGEELISQLLGEVDQMRAAAEANDDQLFRHHDLRLHEIIADVLGNSHLSRTVSNLRAETRRRGAWTANRSRPLIDIHEEHTLVVDALLVGDERAAANAMWAHLEHTGNLLMQQAASVTGEEVPLDWAKQFGSFASQWTRDEPPPQSEE